MLRVRFVLGASERCIENFTNLGFFDFGDGVIL